MSAAIRANRYGCIGDTLLNFKNFLAPATFVLIHRHHITSQLCIILRVKKTETSSRVNFNVSPAHCQLLRRDNLMGGTPPGRLKKGFHLLLSKGLVTHRFHAFFTYSSTDQSDVLFFFLFFLQLHKEIALIVFMFYYCNSRRGKRYASI
jgi:hypothetical protein